MNKSLKKFILWTPRIAGILFVLFLSIFALDIFSMQLSFWQIILGLFMHLIPPFVLAIAVAFAWRWQWIGAGLFLGWSIFYLATARGFDWSVYVLIAGLPALIGLLYLTSWIWREQIRPNS